MKFLILVEKAKSEDNDIIFFKNARLIVAVESRFPDLWLARLADVIDRPR